VLPTEPAGTAHAVHLGATSQDIIDTAAMLIAHRVLADILTGLSAAASTCADLTRAHGGTVMAGRTLPAGGPDHFRPGHGRLADRH
jgi:3-carboxy-cis,cis-muconate cycloisomerase